MTEGRTTGGGERPRGGQPPAGIQRLLLRAPICLYRLHLGWVLGHRFLLLTHRGRRTGRLRHAVLEVVRYDPVTRESIVVSGFGRNSDWYRNLQASPAIAVQTGRLRYVPVQRFLDPAEALAVFADYQRRYPRLARTLLRWLDIPYDGSPAARQALARMLPMVAFRPDRPRSN